MQNLAPQIRGVTARRAEEIRETARSYLVQLAELNKRGELPKRYTYLELLRDAPELVPGRLISTKLEIVYEFPREVSDSEIGGIIDPVSDTIRVASKHSYPRRRFTIAHEIGHAVLHPGIGRHRDLLLDGSIRGSARPLCEREADIFASGFLMPRRYLQKKFFEFFGGPLLGWETDAEICRYVSEKLNRRISTKQFRAMSPLERGVIIASLDYFRGTYFGEPLHEMFAVSKEAIAIELHEIGMIA